MIVKLVDRLVGSVDNAVGVNAIVRCLEQHVSWKHVLYAEMNILDPRRFIRVRSEIPCIAPVRDGRIIIVIKLGRGDRIGETVLPVIGRRKSIERGGAKDGEVALLIHLDETRHRLVRWSVRPRPSSAHYRVVVKLIGKTDFGPKVSFAIVRWSSVSRVECARSEPQEGQGARNVSGSRVGTSRAKK